MSLHHKDIKIATERQGQFKKYCSYETLPPPLKKQTYMTYRAKQQRIELYSILCVLQMGLKYRDKQGK